MDTNNINKRRKRQTLGLNWHKKQQDCFDASEDGAFIVKNDMYTFGSFDSKQAFVSRWCLGDFNKMLPIFELITHDPCALYFDVEQKIAVRQTEEETQEWLRGLLGVIKEQLLTHPDADKLTDADLNLVAVSNDCRPSGTSYKLSFHLTWPNIIFDRNDGAMKRFALDQVKPALAEHSQFVWVEEMKNGTMTKLAVDFGVYTKNRAFRVAYGSKDGRTCLRPWDLDRWEPIKFENKNDQEEWFAASLVSRASVGEHQHVITTPVPSGDICNPSPSVEVDPSIAEWLDQLTTSASQEQELAKKLVPLLSLERAIDWTTWSKVGWVISHTFGGNDEGRGLFHEFSQQAPNYGEASADHIYDTSAGRVTFGSLTVWAKEDNYEAAMAVLGHALRRDAPVVGDKLDEDVIHEMVRKFNTEWEVKLKGEKRKDYPTEYFVARSTLSRNIVLYMNHWLCIIRRTTGSPNVVEETKCEDGTIKFVLRNQKDAEGAYKKHCFEVAGDNKTLTPMTLWSNNRYNREYDEIVFDPNPSKHTPAKLNLFRGLAITKETSVQDDEAASIITDHIKQVWASGDTTITKYLLDWMAHLVQRPWVKMITTPVLKGGQGAGKGIIVQKLGEIIGSAHFMSTTRLDTVTGQFQEEKVKTNLLTFLDECTFAGDKRQSSILKGLLSEEWRRWEGKYVNALTIQNFSNFIIASNYDRIVSVESDDRRFLCLEVDSRWVTGAQTTESKVYFDALAAVNASHFAYFLYNRDITDFNPRKAPSTEYQHFQKKLNLDSCMCWIEDTLQNGEFALLNGTGNEKEVDMMELRFENALDRHEKVRLLKTTVFDSYRAYTGRGDQRFGGVLKDAAVAKKLKIIGARSCKSGPRGEQRPCFEFDMLGKLRESFAKAVCEANWSWNDECDAD